jgi:cytidine deaminase
MQSIDYRQLLQKAADARVNAYAPYSHYAVGACLLAQNGRTYTGCNIENASYSACLCAERACIAQAVSEGVHAFSAIAIVGGVAGEQGDFCPPCGICRQVLAEFCDGDFPVVLCRGEEVIVIPLKDLLPLAFRLED